MSTLAAAVLMWQAGSAAAQCDAQLNRFVSAWNAWAQEYRGGTFNIRLADRANAELRTAKAMGCWPKDGR